MELTWVGQGQRARQGNVETITVSGLLPGSCCRERAIKKLSIELTVNKMRLWLIKIKQNKLNRNFPSM